MVRVFYVVSVVVAFRPLPGQSAAAAVATVFATGDLFMSSLVALGRIFVLETAVRRNAGPVREGVTLVVGAGVVAAVAVVAVTGAVAVRRSRVFAGRASAGHLAREQILNEMIAAVVIVDRANRVLDVNEAFSAVFGLNRRPVGEPLGDLTGSLPTGDPVSLTTADGRRDCVVTRTPLTAANDRRIGETYRIRDVTERGTREQRLDMLNRVLRHDLCNNLDAMDAFVETVERTPQEVDPIEVGTRIGNTATELAAIGSTVERGE
ncbi:MAG: PAS domain-containing protein [Halobaculum sp.]